MIDGAEQLFDAVSLVFQLKGGGGRSLADPPTFGRAMQLGFEKLHGPGDAKDRDLTLVGYRSLQSLQIDQSQELLQFDAVHLEDGFTNAFTLRSYRPRGMQVVREVSVYPATGPSTKVTVTTAGDGCFRLSSPVWQRGSASITASITIDVRS